ncbi:GATA transcription factor 4-like [Typha angustifolia]|uniref:GATA transcription factor 4-like n=1 Tax=Typha angustifolia TaxID=59011 RepID=UPI003C3036EA
MAREWEMGMGFEYGMGMGMGTSLSDACNPTTTSMAMTNNMYGQPSTHDAFRMDDLLDFSNNDLFVSSSAATVTDDHLFPLPEPSMDAVSSSNLQSFHHSFADDIYIPSEEAAELEWLSKFVDDSYSDIPATNLLAPPTDINHLHADNSSVPIRVPRGGRRTSLSSSPSSTTTSSTSSSSDFSSSKMTKSNSKGNKGKHSNGGNSNGSEEGGVRRCTHCASEKTPQWRTGPLGPKTLCNACGVRYKSGRLMPEYRPASSPTFVLTQHSNSHRKVMELRRQKEVLLLRHQNDTSGAGPAPELLFHDYGVC